MTRLQWTDHDGRVYTGEKDRMMELALKAKRNHTLRPCGMFIPKDHLTNQESTVTPSTPTATMSCVAGCDTTHFGFDGVVGFDYCRECGSIAGYPFGTAPQTTTQPRRDESLAHLAEENDRQVRRGDFVEVVHAGPKSRHNIGKRGRVFWTGDDRYRPGLRLGINVESEQEETIWVNSNDIIIKED